MKTCSFVCWEGVGGAGLIYAENANVFCAFTDNKRKVKHCVLNKVNLLNHASFSILTLSRLFLTILNSEKLKKKKKKNGESREWQHSRCCLC